MIKFIFMLFLNISCYSQIISVNNAELNESVLKVYMPFKDKLVTIRCDNAEVNFWQNLNVELNIELINCTIDKKWQKFFEANKDNIVSLNLNDTKWDDLKFILKFNNLRSIYIFSKYTKRLSLDLNEKNFSNLVEFESDVTVDDNFVDFICRSKTLKHVNIWSADVCFIKKIELLKLKKKYTGSAVYPEYSGYIDHYFGNIQRLLKSYEGVFTEENIKRTRLKPGRKKAALLLKENDILAWNLFDKVKNKFTCIEVNNSKYYYQDFFDYKTSIEYIIKYLQYMEFEIPYVIAIFTETDKFEKFISLKELTEMKDMPNASFK